jgi:hypothetical protein
MLAALVAYVVFLMLVVLASVCTAAVAALLFGVFRLTRDVLAWMLPPDAPHTHTPAKVADTQPRTHTHRLR